MNDSMKVVSAVAYSAEEDLFLLMKRAEEKESFPGRWEFPAGKMERKEVREEALRELKEETGFVGEVVKVGESFTIQTEKGEVKVHPVLVLVDHEEPELSREHTDYRWLELEEIQELETVKGLQTDLENVGAKNE